jgi:ubiquinone/menaquinone biosynthesis C-methylase UbiE
VALPPSRNFDRAAPYYDVTRAVPAAAAAALNAQLAFELDDRGRCLEIGVGTGRIALPLHEAGVAMTGVDLSRAMMNVLVDKAGGHVPFPLVQGDATALPFPDHAFGAAVASHVLHLIPGWRVALGEVQRVVRPGGLLLSDRGREDTSPVLQAVRARFRDELGPGAGHVGANHEGDEVERAVLELGARRRELPAVRVTRSVSLARLIESLEAGQWSWTWNVPEQTRHEAAARTRAWANETHGPLDAKVTGAGEVRWLAFDLP